jgi:hypothetical protein
MPSLLMDPNARKPPVGVYRDHIYAGAFRSTIDRQIEHFNMIASGLRCRFGADRNASGHCYGNRRKTASPVHHRFRNSRTASAHLKEPTELNGR